MGVRGAVEDRLRDVPFFRELPTTAVKAIAARLKLQHFRPGQVIFREGDAADTLFLIESGRVHVLSADERQLLAALGPGSILGEIALLLDVPRTATVIAVNQCNAYALSRRSLQDLVRKHPAISGELTRELGRRLRSTSRHVERGRAQQIVAVWGDGVMRLAREVQRARRGQVAIVPMPGAPELGTPPATSITVVDPDDIDLRALALHGLRVDDFDLILLSLPKSRSKEAPRAIDMADQLVACAPPPPWLRTLAAPRPLIDATGGGELERAVRWINGRSVGLVLSSGGSRALAHIGVTEVLKERGIPIDAVSGSSGGALIAGGVALGVGKDELLGYAEGFAKLVRFRKMDFNIRKGALLKGAEIHRQLIRWFAGRTFADAVIPLYIVATDLLTGDEVVITEGLIADAVRASMSIPGVIEPLRLDGRILTDGAVVNPLPASTLKSAGVHRLVASNVAGLGTVAEEDDDVTKLGFLGMMNRVTALREQQLIGRQERLVDGVIRPRVYASNALDFSRIEQFVSAGEAAARLQLPMFEKRIAPAARSTRR